ncbi:unnamed protein product [Pieris brassicae]|uniref:Uncharacterized protein n=2 Tax=Pieris brassicae TaxID=7116 RepID=A0A9P0TKJ1_PIEBR|nr:unnamed protein product [Pieris brassicae]
MGRGLDAASPVATKNVRSVRKARSTATIRRGSGDSMSFSTRPSCQTRSKAFAMSSITAAAPSFLLRAEAAVKSTLVTHKSSTSDSHASTLKEEISLETPNMTPPPSDLVLVELERSLRRTVYLLSNNSMFEIPGLSQVSVRAIL